MSSDLTLYYMPESGPCRTVMLAANVLGIDLKLKLCNLLNGDHYKPEFLKLNPLHAIPTLTDGDLVLIESRVIITYLADQYGTNDSLYPKKDLKTRAQINQRLYFDISNLYGPIIDYYRPPYFGAKTFNESKMPDIKKGFETLNTYLENSKYAVGNNLTLADIGLISSVTTAIAVFEFDLTPYPNVQTWFKLVKANLPGYKEIIEDNANKLRVLVDMFLKKNNSS